MDDEPAIRRLCQRVLSLAGYEADVTADGREAVIAYRQAMRAGRPYDAVILDINVTGGMGGLETLAQLRALEPGVRAIVCSGYADDPVMAEPGRFGFSAVVRKPFAGADLIAAVAELAGRPRSVTEPS